MSYNKIIVPLSVDEENLLRIAASQSCRRPKDHARYIILKSLGLVGDDGSSSVQTNNRHDAKILADQSVTAVGNVNP